MRRREFIAVFGSAAATWALAAHGADVIFTPGRGGARCPGVNDRAGHNAGAAGPCRNRCRSGCALRVDVVARRLVVGVDDARLVVEFDQHDRAVDAVVEGAVIVVRADPGKVRVAQVIERLFQPDLRMARADVMQIDADQIA